MAERLEQLLFDVGKEANSWVDFDGMKAKILNAQAKRRRMRLIRTWGAAAACLVVGICSVLFFGRNFGMAQAADAVALENEEMIRTVAAPAAAAGDAAAVFDGSEAMGADAADGDIATESGPMPEPYCASAAAGGGMENSAPLLPAAAEEYYDYGLSGISEEQLRQRAEGMTEAEITFAVEAPMALEPGQACLLADGTAYYRYAEDAVLCVTAADFDTALVCLEELLAE